MRPRQGRGEAGRDLGQGGADCDERQPDDLFGNAELGGHPHGASDEEFSPDKHRGEASRKERDDGAERSGAGPRGRCPRVIGVTSPA